MRALGWLFDNAINIGMIASALVTLLIGLLATKFATRAGVRKAHAAIYQRLEKEEATRQKDVTSLRERMVQMEGAMAGLANKDDVSKILVALERQDGARNTLSAKVDGVQAELEASSRSLSLIHEHLLNRDRT